MSMAPPRDSRRGRDHVDEGVTMRIRITAAIIAAPVIAAAALLASTGAASAAPVKAGPPPKAVTASTYQAHVTDTTSVPTGFPSDQGPVWAYDNMTRNLIATPASPGT